MEMDGNVKVARFILEKWIWKLYIDKSTGNPLKMEITDINQNITVYILYNEVKINSLDKQNILAFRLYNTKQEI